MAARQARSALQVERLAATTKWALRAAKLSHKNIFFIKYYVEDFMQNVLLVFGGRSYEHDISVVTASQIYSKTRLENIRLIPFYISKNNKFYIYNSIKFNLGDFADFSEER